MEQPQLPPGNMPPGDIPPGSGLESGTAAPIPLPLERPTFYVPMAKPLVSRIILGVLLAMFFVQIVYGIMRYDDWATFGGMDIRTLVDLGAKVNEYIATGEVWRLFTATLLHGSIIHLLFNLYALFAMGPLIEAYLGPRRFLIIYLLGGLFGSLLSYAFSDSISVGASGAIFGILGATTVYFFRYRENFGAQGRAILQNMIVVILINLLFGLSARNIDNWGHLGGLLGGALVAVGLLPKYQPPAVVRYGAQPLQEVDRRRQEALWVIFCTLLFVGGVVLVNMRYEQTVGSLF